MKTILIDFDQVGAIKFIRNICEKTKEDLFLQRLTNFALNGKIMYKDVITNSYD